MLFLLLRKTYPSVQGLDVDSFHYSYCDLVMRQSGQSSGVRPKSKEVCVYWRPNVAMELE